MTSNNPYAPPKSSIGTGSRRVTQIRPMQVTFAVWLLWMSIAFGILTTASDYGRGELRQEPVLVAIYVVVFVSEMAMAILIAQGTNWARLTLLALFSLSFIEIPPVLPQFLGSISRIALNASTLAIELAVIYLLFTHPGSLWFRRVD